MKPYASKCELVSLSEETGLKTYKVWIQKSSMVNGREVKYAITEYAHGRDMQSALTSIMRRPIANRLKRIPNSVYVVLVMLLMALFAYSFMRAPFLTLGWATVATAAGVYLLNKYFKYNE